MVSVAAQMGVNSERGCRAKRKELKEQLEEGVDADS